MLYFIPIFSSILFLSVTTNLNASEFDHSLNRLTLKSAENLSLNNEPGIISHQWQAEALLEQAVADGQMMDPKLQLSFANLPTDTFNFDQENMTQFKIGVMQQFPAGNSLKLKQQKTQKKAQLFESKIAERKLTILKKVRLNYLEIYYWEQAKKTIEQNKKLFSQLVEIVQSLFSVGRNNQQDLIRAQLELSRLDDRQAKITQKINIQRAQLSRWIGSKNSRMAIDGALPDISLPSKLSLLDSDSQSEQITAFFFTHPKVINIDKKIEVSQKDIELARESFKPGWGLNLSYGYRDDNPNGMERSDFFSVGVSFDLPVFTENRQDKKLLSKEYTFQALKDQRINLLRQLQADLQQEIVNEEQLSKRHHLYNTILLPQAKQQTTASLLAYQSDRGSFADVMRAHIDQLNANLDERRIAVDHVQTRARILYFITEK